MLRAHYRSVRVRPVRVRPVSESGLRRTGPDSETGLTRTQACAPSGPTRHGPKGQRDGETAARAGGEGLFESRIARRQGGPLPTATIRWARGGGLSPPPRRLRDPCTLQTFPSQTCPSQTCPRQTRPSQTCPDALGTEPSLQRLEAAGRAVRPARPLADHALERSPIAKLDTGRVSGHRGFGRTLPWPAVSRSAAHNV